MIREEEQHDADRDQPVAPRKTSSSAAWVGEYADRRDRGQAPRTHDLLARAAEFGDGATAKLRTILALYEALLADDAPR
ncbi:MAG: hypothetical protein ACXVFI_17530 [Solirubrobacteraceae bacterium]